MGTEMGLTVPMNARHELQRSFGRKVFKSLKIFNDSTFLSVRRWWWPDLATVGRRRARFCRVMPSWLRRRDAGRHILNCLLFAAPPRDMGPHFCFRFSGESYFSFVSDLLLMLCRFPAGCVRRTRERISVDDNNRFATWKYFWDSQDS